MFREPLHDPKCFGTAAVNVPAPERYAVHKLVVFRERGAKERAKARGSLPPPRIAAHILDAAPLSEDPCRKLHDSQPRYGSPVVAQPVRKKTAPEW